MSTCAWTALSTILSMSVMPAFAHHSFSVAFDEQRPVSVDRVVTEVKWENPHSWILTGRWTTPAIRVKRASEVKVREAMCLDTTTYGLTQKGRQERAAP